jgi:hypothetical protein
VSEARFELAQLTPMELLSLHSSIGDELMHRKLVRSANNPAGDLAETLFCKTFGWTQAPASMPAADAIDANQVRIQIKSRRLTTSNGSRQLSAIRNLNRAGFDILAGVLFNKDYSIFRAALVPFARIQELSSHQNHTNSALFQLRDSVWDFSDVIDVTSQLRAFAVQWKSPSL